MLDMLPTIFDTTRTLVVTNADNTMKTVTINKPAGFDQNGNQMLQNEISKGKFVVEIKPGAPSGLHKKENLLALAPLTQNPQTQNLVWDQYVANLDLPNTPQLVKRFKTLVPPQIQVEEGTMTPQQAQQMAQQAAQSPQAQIAQQQIHSEQAKAQADVMGAQADMLKARSDMAKAVGDTQTSQTKAAAEMGKAQLEFRKEAVKADSEQKDEIIRQMGEAITQLQAERAQILSSASQMGES